VTKKERVLVDLDELVADITMDAYGDDEQLTAFFEVFASEVRTPAAATVLGTELEVLGFDYVDVRQGIVARVRRQGAEQDVHVADLIFPSDSVAARVQAAYRRWLGLAPHPTHLPAGWRPAWL
jgi:hypothetical protein